MNQSYIITKEGLVKLQHEVSALKDEKRPVAVERLKRAREMGDLSENSEYSASREDLSMLDGRINELEEMIKRAKVTEHIKNNDIVEIGESVLVEVGGTKDTITVVGELEADVSTKKLSNTSPIGKALLGRRVGESVEVVIPAGKVIYKILEIK